MFDVEENQKISAFNNFVYKLTKYTEMRMVDPYDANFLKDKYELYEACDYIGKIFNIKGTIKEDIGGKMPIYFIYKENSND